MYGALEGDVVLGCLSTFVQSVSRILKLPKLKLSGSGKCPVLVIFFTKNLCKSHQVIQVSVHNDYDMTPQKKTRRCPQDLLKAVDSHCLDEHPLLICQFLWFHGNMSLSEPARSLMF
jgi:hypothetical protein